MNQVFDVKINVMQNVDLDIISDIENKCIHGDCLNFSEIDYFLNYVVYKTRSILSSMKKEDIMNYNYNFMCDTAQSIIARYFDEVNITYKPVETQKAITNDIIGHSFLIADFLVSGKYISYIIDPTYNQFFSVNKCGENNFKVVNGVVLKTPDLGYFALKSDENIQNVVKRLLRNGYILLNEENAKIYGDLFYKTKTGNINYFNSKLEMPGSIYIKGFRNSLAKLTYTLDDLQNMGISLNPIFQKNLNKKRV